MYHSQGRISSQLKLLSSVSTISKSNLEKNRKLFPKLVTCDHSCTNDNIVAKIDNNVPRFILQSFSNKYSGENKFYLPKCTKHVVPIHRLFRK